MERDLREQRVRMERDLRAQEEASEKMERDLRGQAEGGADFFDYEWNGLYDQRGLIRNEEPVFAINSLTTPADAIRHILSLPATTPGYHYRILGLGQFAQVTQREIRKAYRKLTLLVHPDKNPEDKEGVERAFKVLGRA